MDWWANDPFYQVPLLMLVAICYHVGIETHPTPNDLRQIFRSFAPAHLRHTYTSRLVYTVVPSECYAPGGATVDGLLEALVSDLVQLETDGLEAGCGKTCGYKYIGFGFQSLF